MTSYFYKHTGDPDVIAMIVDPDAIFIIQRQRKPRSLAGSRLQQRRPVLDGQLGGEASSRYLSKADLPSGRQTLLTQMRVSVGSSISNDGLRVK